MSKQTADEELNEELRLIEAHLQRLTLRVTDLRERREGTNGRRRNIQIGDRVRIRVTTLLIPTRVEGTVVATTEQRVRVQYTQANGTSTTALRAFHNVELIEQDGRRSADPAPSGGPGPRSGN